MYVYKSVAESRVTNVHHIIHSALTGSRSPAGPRRLGTATRISASLFRRLSAFFWSTPSQDPKAAKFAVLILGPGMFVNVRNGPRVVIPPSSETPLFRRVSRCVRSCWRRRVCSRRAAPSSTCCHHAVTSHSVSSAPIRLPCHKRSQHTSVRFPGQQ